MSSVCVCVGLPSNRGAPNPHLDVQHCVACWRVDLLDIEYLWREGSPPGVSLLVLTLSRGRWTAKASDAHTSFCSSSVCENTALIMPVYRGLQGRSHPSGEVRRVEEASCCTRAPSLSPAGGPSCRRCIPQACAAHTPSQLRSHRPPFDRLAWLLLSSPLTVHSLTNARGSFTRHRPSSQSKAASAPNTKNKGNKARRKRGTGRLLRESGVPQERVKTPRLRHKRANESRL